MERDKVEQEKKRLLAEYQKSGKSMAAFSRESGISVHRLYGLNKAVREKKEESRFVRVGETATATVLVDERIRIEVGVGNLRELLLELGVKV